MATNKNWWAPVWRGLVADPEGKHYRKMKSAVWLLFYLILHADRRTGKLKRKFKTTANEMGVPQKTIQRWLNVLKDKKYVETRNNGRCLEIVINKWKNTQAHSNVRPQESRLWSIRIDKAEESRGASNAGKPLF